MDAPDRRGHRADGLTVIGLPLATPETIGWLGYRPARRLARALGVLLVLVGIWICL